MRKPTCDLVEEERLLTDAEAAEILGVTTGTLATWRCTKRYALKWIKVGRKIRYRLTDVVEWIDSRTQDGGDIGEFGNASKA